MMKAILMPVAGCLAAVLCILPAGAARAQTADEVETVLEIEAMTEGWAEAQTNAESAMYSAVLAVEAEEIDWQTTLAEQQAELDAAQHEVVRLRSLIRRMWDLTKRERLNMHYNMGCVYRAARQYKLAENEFLKALEIDPTDTWVHYNLGILYEDDLKDKEKAREHYERFLELAPDGKDAARVSEWLQSLQ
jgi:tetratricopeptide (TPR) repeat protein